MNKSEYKAIQRALDNHLERVLTYDPLSREERNAYEKAVMACKSVISKTCEVDPDDER